MFGVFLDSTARKEAEEAREMLAGEMSHRVKNLFPIASSLASMAARSAATTTQMGRDLRQRLATLGRAHDLIRPMLGIDSPGLGCSAICSPSFSRPTTPRVLSATASGCRCPKCA
jgi:hypothetical protein